MLGRFRSKKKRESILNGSDVFEKSGGRLNMYAPNRQEQLNFEANSALLWQEVTSSETTNNSNGGL